MSGFAYFWRQHTTKVTGSILRRMKCDGCSFEFEYVAARDGWGGGHSPFIVFNNAGAAAAAEKRARASLNRALDEAVEAVPCPACGIYQPDMVRALRKR
jgi:hypothetical protein